MTTITRETLELAALAAGLKHVNYDGLGYDGRDGLVLVDGIGRHLEDWRPHTDIADAARLAVRLDMSVSTDGSTAFAYVDNYDEMDSRDCGGSDHDGTEPDKLRAYCEAVTLCAAEIGRRMREGGR